MVRCGSTSRIEPCRCGTPWTDGATAKWFATRVWLGTSEKTRFWPLRSGPDHCPYMYVCMFRPPTDPYRHTRYGGSRALLPPRITLGRPCFRTRQRVGASDLLRSRQAHAMASHARHCSRGLRYRSRYCRSPHDHRVWGCLSACARMTHSCQLPMRKQARRHCFHPHMAWDARCQDEHRLTSHRSELPRCRCLYRPTARDLT